MRSATSGAWPPRRSSGPERHLLWLGGFAGAIFVFLTPPGQGPDEPERFLRAFAVAEGSVLPQRSGGSVGDEVPRSLAVSLAPFERLQRAPERKTSMAEVASALRVPLDPEDRTFVALPAAATLSVATYAQAVAGAWVGRFFELPPIAILWLARFADLTAGLALAWVAIRTAPVARWLLAALALAPMALFLRSTVSADVTALGVTLLWVALLLDAREGAGPPRRGGIVAVAACLGLVKFGYAQLALLVFAVPAERCGGPVAARWLRLGVLAAALATATISAAWAIHFAAPIRPDAAVDPAAQLRAVIAHPLHFASLVTWDAILNGPRYGAEFIGNLGWLDTRLPNPLRFLYALLLVTVAVLDGPRGLRGRDRALALGLVVVTVVGLALSQYLTWTPLGAEEIDGLQGRYYLPLAPAAALVLARTRAPGHPSEGMLAWIVGTIVAGSTLASLVVVALRYYA